MTHERFSTVSKEQVEQERIAYRENGQMNQMKLRDGFFDADAGLVEMIEQLEIANDPKLARVLEAVKKAQAALNETELGYWM